MAMTAGPKANATLIDWQAYVQQKITERGFADETTQQQFMLLVEEVGELAKALRPLEGIKTSDDSEKLELAHEAADVFWMLCCVCNGLSIDLDEALRSKDAKNEKRVWK
jgi:NTP pyrophosphatase (non-canonical NTP hydrolase)